MRAARFAGLLLVFALGACSSTQPPVAGVPDQPVLPTVTPVQPTRSRPAATPTQPAPTATAATVAPGETQTTSDAPVTASMAQIGVGGEQYAALGDPNAPITMIEFSDYG